MKVLQTSHRPINGLDRSKRHLRERENNQNNNWTTTRKQATKSQTTIVHRQTLARKDLTICVTACQLQDVQPRYLRVHTHYSKFVLVGIYILTRTSLLRPCTSEWHSWSNCFGFGVHLPGIGVVWTAPLPKLWVAEFHRTTDLNWIGAHIGV